MKVDIDCNENKYEVKIDSSDLWSLNFTLSQIIHPALIKFKEEETGGCAIDKEDVPESLHETYGEEEFGEKFSHEAWLYILDEMIWSFGETKNQYNDAPEFNTQDYKIYSDRVKNGFRLFGKYYQTLWN